MTTPSNPSLLASLRSSSAGMAFAVATVLAAVSGSAQAGRIVVNHDEWTWSDAGFSNAGSTNAATFAQNVVKFLDTDGTAGGNVLVYSNNFGFGGSFVSALGAVGYTATVNTAARTAATAKAMPALDERSDARIDGLVGLDGVVIGGLLDAMGVPTNCRTAHLRPISRRWGVIYAGSAPAWGGMRSTASVMRPLMPSPSKRFASAGSFTV